MNPLDGRKIYTVTELNREIKIILNDSYPDVWVQGEISNFKAYSSGHQYFSLKDAEGQIAAVIFNGTQRFARFAFEDGLNVIVRGKIDVYPPRGNYQFIVSQIEPAGKGALQLAFEQLKKKLESEGLFSSERKRPIPAMPQRIGIVTSPTGAAIHDILTVINRRFSNVEILIYPVRVQGSEAASEIAGAIAYLNKYHAELDVLLVGRGGGSYEDLWSFNEEIVARAIASSAIPVISCVGHETDVTIADFVADLRAPTPSAAAELVVRNKRELADLITQREQRLSAAMHHVIQRAEQRVAAAQSSRALTRPDEIFEERIQHVDDCLQRMQQQLSLTFERRDNRISALSDKLGILSPLATLKRGFAVCRDTATGAVISSADRLQAGSSVSLGFHTGTACATVTSVTLQENIINGKKTKL